VKNVLFVLLFLLLAAAAYLYFYPENAPDWLKESVVAPQAESTLLYKWKDAQGNITVTDQPPPEGTPYEKQEYHHNVNVLPLPAELRPQE